MVASPRFRVALLLSVALALALSGTWLATSTAAPSYDRPARAGELITYHGTASKAVLPLRANRLPGAPKAFRTFVKQQLHEVWEAMGHSPACKTAPLVKVSAIRTDGFALGAVVTRSRRHCMGGGGAAAIWAVRHGEWKEVIATQDMWPCDRLIKFHIPSEIGVDECFESGSNQVVPYDQP